MANLVPLSNSSLVTTKKSSIIKSDKFLAISPKSSSSITKAPEVKSPDIKPQNLNDNPLTQIYKKIVKIDKLLKNSLFLSKKESEKERLKDEKKEFENREKELEKKKPKPIPGIKLPSLPKMGFLDWIKNFITQTVLGFFAVRLIEHLPKLLSILPAIIKVSDFVVGVGGKLLDGLISFIDFGYKAYDSTRGFVKNLGGDELVKNFDKFTGALNTMMNVAVLAAISAASMGDGGSRGEPQGFFRRGDTREIGKRMQGKALYLNSNKSFQQVDDAIMKRYFQRYGRDQFIQRFGEEGLKRLPGGMQRGLLQRGARSAFVGLAGKGGAKAILKFTKPLLKRIPVIGALVDFGLSVALGESPGRAAFKAVGAGLLGAIGVAIGSVVPFAGNIIGGIVGGVAGDAIGGALYDMFFGGKKPKNKVTKASGGGLPTSRNGRVVKGPSRRTIKKKKKPRTLSFTPRKIKPGQNTGGEAKVQQVFPNTDKPWWDPFGLFTRKKQKPQEQKQKKPKGKTANPQEFLVGSNDVLGRAKYFIGPTATLILKTVLGQKPDELDYKNVAKGYGAFTQTIFSESSLGFAGGGEVDARQYFSGEDYTNVIAKIIKDSSSKEVDTTIRNLSRELSLRTAETEEERRQRDESGGGGGAGEGDYGEEPHGTPGPAVKTTKGFNAGKGDRTRRIFLHWTAGNYNQNFNNYHTTFLSDGTAVRNTSNYGVDKPSPGHTGGANTNSVGLSIAAMGGEGVNENRFGKFPPTSAQVSAMALEAARLAVAWGWDESTIDKNVMTHGEWERYATRTGKLPGDPERWDLDKLRQGDPMNSGGDKLRKMIKAYFRKLRMGTIIDDTGTTKVTSTGAPIAQMSLETAMEMMEPGTGRAGRVSGGNADFWTLVAVAAREDGDPQGRADVAQSIYNRAAAGKVFPGGPSIRGIILARTQYQPTRDYPRKNPSGDTNPEWYQITDAESAARATGMSVSAMRSVAQQLMNPTLRKKAAEYIENRTDFLGIGLTPSKPSSTEVRRRTPHDNIFGNFVGPGSFEYGRKKSGAASAPSLGVTVTAGTSPGGSTNVGSGKFNIVEYITGDVNYRGDGRKFYYDREGHGLPSNYHDHIAFATVAEKERAKRALIAAGIEIGSENDGRHAVGSYHYRNLAFDVPGHQWRGRGAIGPTEYAGSRRVRQILGIGINPPRFHGGPILKTGYFWGHKGEYVIDADSVKLFGDIIPDINFIENKSQLIAKAPSIIEKLKSISGYADYERTDPQYIIVKVPVEDPVPISSGSGRVFVVGSIDNKIPGIEALNAIG